jgi:hypothetical protein
MPYSTCCGAHTTMTEIDICPDCREHCDWEDDELEEDRTLSHLQYNLNRDKMAENEKH